MVGFRKDRIDIWSANTVAMQPLVLSVTLVNVWSRSDGYAHMHVYTHTHTDRHIHAGTHSSPRTHSGSVI